MTKTPIVVAWKSYVAGHADAPALPATLGTPADAWAYGAATDLIETGTEATVVIEAQALRGSIGLCLISEDHSKLASAQRQLRPEDGKVTVRLAFSPSKSPARILLRNYADGGTPGEARIDSATLEEA